jgi:hypothetical protein
MKGPGGDAILFIVFVLCLLLCTVKLWYPPLVKFIRHVQEDLDKLEHEEEDPPKLQGSKVRHALEGTKPDPYAVTQATRRFYEEEMMKEIHRRKKNA